MTKLSILQGIIESHDCPIFSLDIHYCYTSFNQAHYLTMRGLYGADIELGKNLLEYQTVAADREKTKAHLDRALQGERFVAGAYSGDENRVRRFFEVIHNPVKDEDGQVVGVAVFAGDITTRRSAEAELEKSENRFRSMFENHQAMMMLIKPDSGAIVDANMAAAGFYGYSREQLRTMFIHEINNLTSGEVSRLLLNTLNEHKGHFKFPHRLAGGEIKWVEVYSTPIDIQGNPLLFSVIHDITDRKIAEEALLIHKKWLEEARRESEERYRDLFKNSPGAIILHDGERILEVNPALGKLLGLADPDDLTGVNLLDIIVPAHRERVVSRALRGGKSPTASLELQLLRRDGGTVDAEIVSGICHYRGRQVYQVIFHDFSERKQMENALRLSEERFRILAETLPQLVWMADSTGKIGYCNRQFHHYTGITTKELTDRDWMALVHPDDYERRIAGWREAIGNGNLYQIEYRLKRHDGEYRWFLGRGLPLRDCQGKIISWFGTCTDINYQKQLEIELQETNSRLHQLHNRVMIALEDERSMIARELHDEAGQALTAVKISLELIHKELSSGHKLREAIGDAVALADQTLNNIRRLARGLHPPVLDALGLNLALEDFCHEFGGRVGLDIRYQGCELPALAGTASISLYRFLQEALTNVVKHAKADRVKVRLDFDQRQVSLRVEDNGMGIAAGSENYREKGMGLVGMEERLMMHGGKLTVDSGPGRGMRLTATLPREVGE
jgi:PAS domain S-box-containing protein